MFLHFPTQNSIQARMFMDFPACHVSLQELMGKYKDYLLKAPWPAPVSWHFPEKFSAAALWLGRLSNGRGRETKGCKVYNSQKNSTSVSSFMMFLDLFGVTKCQWGVVSNLLLGYGSRQPSAVAVSLSTTGWFCGWWLIIWIWSTPHCCTIQSFQKFSHHRQVHAQAKVLDFYIYIL